MHGPGAVATGIVAALGLLTFGGLLAARRLDLFDGPVVLTALGVVVVIAGLVTAVSGLRGRSSGGVGGMAVLAVLAGVPLALWSGTGVSLSDASTSFAGNATFVPDSATEAGHGYALIAGEWTIDLREVPLDGGTLTVPVTMAAGQLTVIVPPEAAVDATVRLAAGEAAIELDGERSTADGLFLRPLQREDTDAASGDDPDLVLDIHGAAGQVLVTEKG